MMGKAKSGEGKLFYTNVTLESRIPEGHPLRKVKQVVDFGFVREEVVGLYGRRGNPSVDPAVLLKLMFLLFFEGVKSERELMVQMRYRLDWLWFCGYDIDEEVPDHSVLSKARRRWGPKVFGELFQRVLSQCVGAGLVDGSVVHVDGSVIRANASMESLRPVSEALYRRLDEAAGGVEVPGEGSSGEGDGGQAGRQEKDREIVVSPTDPDARLTKKGVKTTLGYKEHRVVDDRYGVITVSETTDACQAEARQIAGILDAHRENTGTVERAVVADKGYGTAEVYQEMSRRGAKPCIPHQKWGCSRGTFGTHMFKYDGERDCYVCPGGRLLERAGRRGIRAGKVVKYYARGEDCACCQLRARCTSNECGRIVKRDAGQKYVEWADGCYVGSQRRYLQGRRRTVAEGSFADAANNHTYKRARWRRLWRMKIQNLLICVCQNVRKMLRYGMGRPVCAAQRAALPVHGRRSGISATTSALTGALMLMCATIVARMMARRAILITQHAGAI